MKGKTSTTLHNSFQTKTSPVRTKFSLIKKVTYKILTKRVGIIWSRSLNKGNFN